MSNYGVFESAFTDDHDERTAQADREALLRSAIFDAREQFGSFLSSAKDKGDFKDRVALVKNDMMKVVANSLMPVPGVMRKVEGALKPDFTKTAAGLDEFQNMLRANWGASFDEFLNEFDEESQRDAREEFKNTFGVTDADLNGFLPSIGASRKQAGTRETGDAHADAMKALRESAQDFVVDALDNAVKSGEYVWNYDPEVPNVIGLQSRMGNSNEASVVVYLGGDDGFDDFEIDEQWLMGLKQASEFHKTARTEEEIRKVRDDLDKELSDALDEGGQKEKVQELRQKLRDIDDELSDSMRESSRKQAGEGDFPVAAGDKDYLLNKMQQKRYEIFPEFVAIPNPFQPPQRGIWSLIEDPVVNGPNRVFISYGHPGQDPNVSRRGWYAMVGDRVVTEGWPHIEDTFYEIKHVLERVDGYQSSVKQANAHEWGDAQDQFSFWLEDEYGIEHDEDAPEGALEEYLQEMPHMRKYFSSKKAAEYEDGDFWEGDENPVYADPVELEDWIDEDEEW